LAEGLLSTNSVGVSPIFPGCFPLFIRLIDTIPPSDFQRYNHVGRSATGLLQPYQLWIITGSPLGSPGFRSKSLSTCTSSMTPRIQFVTCDYATYCFAFPIKSQGRQSE
jgi:hypothetical protein